MKISTRTAAGNRWLTAMAWGMEFVADPGRNIKDTLNDVSVISTPPTPMNRGMYIEGTYNATTETKELKTDLIMIGRGGHGYSTSEEGEIDPITYPHAATDAGLFSPTPWLIRKVTEDLTGEMKAKYRLRRTFIKDGELYAAYFGRKIDLSRNEITEVLETVADGKVISTRPYELTANDLRPQKTPLDTESPGVYLRTYASFDLIMTEEEVEEYIMACTTLYGSPNKAIISEIAYCFGKDKPVTKMYSTNEGSLTQVDAPANTLEHVCTHVMVFETAYKPAIYTGAFGETKNIGISEPLYGTR